MKSKFKIQNSKFIFCLLLSAFCFFPLFAQKTTITGKIENNKFGLVDLKLLYKDDGILFGSAKINADGSFKLNANLSKTELFKLVFDGDSFLMMCVSPNQNIELTLDAQNITYVKSVKGSPSIEFYKTATEMITPWQTLLDSVRSVLQTNKEVQFYNEFQSQFKPYADANAEADAFCVQVATTTDAFQQFVNSKLIKGKVDSKETDAFIYTNSNFLKEILAQYTKYKSYMQSMSLFYDFANKKNAKFEDFYNTSVGKYLEFLELRNAKMENTFSDFITHVEYYLHFRDSLQINDLADKKKEKDFMVAKIIALSKMCPNIKEAESVLINHTKTTDGYAKYSLQEAQRRASTMVQKYQTFFDNENKKRSEVIANLLLAHKDDLTVLLFLDIFPRDQNQKFHQEVLKALYEKYPDHPLVKERFKQETSSASVTAVGAMAPDLAFENPEGKIMKLSDLKGNVVLLDFWAAWCRPCRMENPNVVKAYNKYHDKGFEVFSVSLDKDKASWIKAIEADGLIWPYHVSDLGYWQSQAAKIYGVSSIPATFLIGRDGRIVAKNLRGAALENALKELLE